MSESNSPIIGWHTYNKYLKNAFETAAWTGLGITLIATPLRLGLFGPIEQLPDIAQYYADHMKGIGDALFYGQALNGYFNYKNNESLTPSSSPIKDHTNESAMIVLAAGTAYEFLTKMALNKPALDTHDLLAYGIGITAMLAWNKGVTAYAKKHLAPAPENN